VETQKLNVHVPDEIAKMLLWEYTGYPAFWYLDEAPEECRAQVRTVIRQNLYAWQIQFPPPDKPPVGPSVYERLLRRDL
jgi:ferric iron reductase protein FhuF